MQRTKTPPLILVVEDYADTRQMLKLLLESFGYSVLTAATGTEALSIASNRPVDLILMDFGLPDMTGPTVARQISNGSARVPVIMLTAFDGCEYSELASEAGCDAYLTKPPDFEVLKRTLDQLLQKRRMETDSAFNPAKSDENDRESSSELFAWQYEYEG